jgi:spermidine/putrescine-binding protein
MPPNPGDAATAGADENFMTPFPSARRTLLTIAALALALAATGCKKDAADPAADASATDKTVNALLFTEYVPKDVIEDFRKETGITVNVGTIESNEQLLQKLAAGASVSDYDVVNASDYMVKRLADPQLLRKLDRAKLPGLANLDPACLGKPFDPGNEYSVPLFWGLTGIGYSRKAVGGDVDSWAAVFDPKFKGKIVMLDDPRELLAAALRLAGKGVNERDPATLEAAKAALKRQHPLVLKYDTDQFAEKLAAGDATIAQGFNGQFAKEIKKNADLAFVVPKEGGTLWIDHLCVPTAARRSANAHAFIDYLMRPDVAARLANYAAYGSANKAARPKIDPARLNDPVVYPPADVLARCAVMEDLGAANKMADTLMEDIKAKD